MMLSISVNAGRLYVNIPDSKGIVWPYLVRQDKTEADHNPPTWRFCLTKLLENDDGELIEVDSYWCCFGGLFPNGNCTCRDFIYRKQAKKNFCKHLVVCVELAKLKCVLEIA